MWFTWGPHAATQEKAALRAPVALLGKCRRWHGRCEGDYTIHSWRWTCSRWMVVRCRKEELRYDGRCPCSRCGDEPRTERHWLLLLGPSTSPALRNMQSLSQCSQQVVDKSFKN